VIVVFSARYRIDIGPHVFPTDKYQRVHARLLETGVIRPSDVVEPEPASWEDLARVHTADYLERMRHGAMTAADVQQLELPWSREMVEGFRLMTGGTIQASLIACGLEVGSLKSEVRSTDADPTSNFGLQASNFRVAVESYLKLKIKKL